MGSDCFKAIRRISRIEDPCLVGFSTGRDSIVMLDLLMKHYMGSMTFVFYYFVPNLEFKERLLRYYEKKYGITIHRRPHWVTLSYMTGRKSKESDVTRMTRNEFDISWFALGVRRNESLNRRARCSESVGVFDGIDERNKYLYPVVDFTVKEINAYIKINGLVTGEEYKWGLRHDMNIMDDEGLLLIKRVYPDDYRKIIECFPQLEAKVFRAEKLRGK